jgi:hypothetical protein
MRIYTLPKNIPPLWGLKTLNFDKLIKERSIIIDNSYLSMNLLLFAKLLRLPELDRDNKYRHQ